MQYPDPRTYPITSVVLSISKLFAPRNWLLVGIFCSDEVIPGVGKGVNYIKLLASPPPTHPQLNCRRRSGCGRFGRGKYRGTQMHEVLIQNDAKSQKMKPKWAKRVMGETFPHLVLGILFGYFLDAFCVLCIF